MKKMTLMAVTALTAIVAGCVVTSVHPFYTDKDLVFEAALAGDWLKEAADSQPDSQPAVWKFERSGELAYRFTLIESRKAAVMEAHAFKLQGQLFLDIFSMDQDIRVAPWASTIMRGGGMTVLPQEPFRSHDQCLSAARALVVWYFTNLADPRWRIGDRYICLSTDEQRPEPQKIGISNKQKWCGYLVERALFVKRFDYLPGAEYPDFGSNNETYTTRNYMEVESLGPLRTLDPGQSAEHTEEWFLFPNASAGPDEESLHAAISPLIAELGPSTKEDLR